MALANHGTTSPPSNATDAVLKPSEPVPEDSTEVQGIEFNDYADRAITVEELVAGYASMGFQATAVGEAVRIVNDMVSGLRRRQAATRPGARTAWPKAAGDSTDPCASAGSRNDLAGIGKLIPPSQAWSCA
jgi:hypothetical protein